MKRSRFLAVALAIFSATSPARAQETPKPKPARFALRGVTQSDLDNALKSAQADWGVAIPLTIEMKPLTSCKMNFFGYSSHLATTKVDVTITTTVDANSTQVKIKRRRATITFNSNCAWDIRRLEETAKHEYGHALGFVEHSQDPHSIMFPQETKLVVNEIAFHPERRVITDQDRALLNSLMAGWAVLTPQELAASASSFVSSQQSNSSLTSPQQSASSLASPQQSTSSLTLPQETLASSQETSTSQSFIFDEIPVITKTALNDALKRARDVWGVSIPVSIQLDSTMNECRRDPVSSKPAPIIARSESLAVSAKMITELVNPDPASMPTESRSHVIVINDQYGGWNKRLLENATINAYGLALGVPMSADSGSVMYPIISENGVITPADRAALKGLPTAPGFFLPTFSCNASMYTP